MMEQKCKPKDDLQFEELQPYIRVIFYNLFFKTAVKYCFNALVFGVTKICVEYSCFNIAPAISTRKG